MHVSLNRKAAQMMTALACVATTAQLASAQARSSVSGFSPGYNDIGFVIGLGGLGGASLSFGGRFEHAVKALPDLGHGVLGIEAAFDYYAWSGGSGLGSYTWKYIPIGVTANYHIKLDDPTFDPFIGLGLGYQIITCTAPGYPNGYCSNSNLYFIGRLGARYFFSPSLAGYLDVGAGAATLNIGLMFRLM